MSDPRFAHVVNGKFWISLGIPAKRISDGLSEVNGAWANIPRAL